MEDTAAAVQEQASARHLRRAGLWFAIAAVWFVVADHVLDKATDVDPLYLVHYPGESVLGGRARFDARWYAEIADRGYDDAQVNSTAAFFPAYPLTMRAAAVVVRDPVI